MGTQELPYRSPIRDASRSRTMSNDDKKPGERTPKPMNTPSAQERGKPKPWLHQPAKGEGDEKD